MDETESLLTRGSKVKSGFADSIESDQYTGWLPNISVFMGRRNLGVAAQSNKAIAWMRHIRADHLVIINDDIEVRGPFEDFYRKAHADLGIGMFCFCDFTSDSYRWRSARSNGYTVKILSRMTGIAISITRDLVDRIGYFDTRFGKFGEEHCDYTHRARMAGLLKFEGSDVLCVDVDHKFLAHQEVETSLQGPERGRADAIASMVMSQVGPLYATTNPYRKFSLETPLVAGGRDGEGISTTALNRYTFVPAV